MGTAERKEREKENRKTAILQAAEKTFFSNGFDQSTMDQVAKEAELSKGTLYLYFNNKEDLLLEVTVKGLEVLGRMMKDQYKKDRTGLEIAYQMGRTYVQFSKDHQNYYDSLVRFESQMVDKVPEDKLQKIINTNSPLALLKEVLEKGKKDGSIRKDISSAELAIILWTQLTGILQFIRSRQRLLDMLECHEEQLIKNQLKMVHDSIAATHET